MTSKQLTYLLFGILGAICLAIVCGAYSINSLLQGRSDTLSALKSKSDDISNQQLQVLTDQQSLKKYADLNTIAQTVVPQDKNSDIVVRQIINLAAQSGISNLAGGITFPSSSLGSSTSTTGANPNSSQNKLTQLTKVKGISGVYDLPITVQQSDTVSYSHFITFLRKLQQNRRTANISSVSITPDTKNPSQVTFSLVIDEYIKP